MRRVLPVLLLIGAVGAGLRLFHLDHSLRVDEMETWSNSRRHLEDILSDEDRPPHVSLLTSLSVRLIGDREAALRLPYTLYGIAALPLIFLLGRRLFDEETGLAACLLLSASVLHIRFSQEARYYAPFVFYSISSLYFLLIAVEGAGKRRGAVKKALPWAGLAIVTFLDLQLHRFALYPLVLCSVLLVLAVAESRVRGETARFTELGRACACAAALGFSLLYAEGVWKFLHFEGAGRLTLRESYLTWHYRSSGESILWAFLKEYSGGRSAGLLYLAAGAAGVFLRGGRRRRTGVVMLVWLALPLLSLFVVRSRTHFELRYFSFLLPVWILWAASGAASIGVFLFSKAGRPRANRPAAAGAMAGILLLSSMPALAGYYRLPKSRMREAFAEIGGRCLPGDAVVMYPPWDVLWYGYYRLPGGCRLLHPANIREGSPAFAAGDVFREHRRIWLGATWISDRVRGGEFARIRGLMGRFFDLENSIRLRSRDENDDYRIYGYRRKPGVSFESLRRGLDSAPGGPRGARTPPLRGRMYRLLANIHEVAGALDGVAAPRFRIARSSRLLKVGDKGLRSGGERAPAGFYYVWSGSGTVSAGRWRRAFIPGDLLVLPRGLRSRWCAATGKKAVVLRVDARPDEGGGEGPDVDAPKLLGNTGGAGSAENAGPEGGATMFHGGGWRVLLHRLRAGRAEWREQVFSGPVIVTGLVVSGVMGLRVHSIEDAFFNPREGDLHAYKMRYPGEVSFSNPGDRDAAELQFVRENIPPRRPADVMTFRTGKEGAGAWPPMLIR